LAVRPTEPDWSLQRKGPADEARHQERVRAAIREHLEEIVADPAIVTGDGHAIVRVPVRSLREYRFRYDEERQAHVGSGNGGTAVGQVLARGAPGSAGAPGGAGSEGGRQVMEAEVSVEDLAEIVFADLCLPHLERKAGPLRLDADRSGGLRRRGPLSALDKRRSLLQNLRRNAAAGSPALGAWQENDLRFRSWHAAPGPSTAAVVIAMRDVSGSMGEWKKHMARSFFFWMIRFLRTRYDDVQLVFIAHHTEAREVDEQTFFHLGESGGTRVSSAYELALQVMRARFSPQAWNVYPFHFSDAERQRGRCARRPVGRSPAGRAPSAPAPQPIGARLQAWGASVRPGWPPGRGPPAPSAAPQPEARVGCRPRRAIGRSAAGDRRAVGPPSARPWRGRRRRRCGPRRRGG